VNTCIVVGIEQRAIRLGIGIPIDHVRVCNTKLASHLIAVLTLGDLVELVTICSDGRLYGRRSRQASCGSNASIVVCV
jgi:hypothetical protein